MMVLLILAAWSVASELDSQQQQISRDTKELRVGGLHFRFLSSPDLPVHLTVSNIDGFTMGHCVHGVCYKQASGTLPAKADLSRGTLKARVRIPVEWRELAAQEHRRIRVLNNEREVQPRVIDATSVTADVTLPGTIILVLRDDRSPGRLRFSSATAASDSIQFDWIATGDDGDEGLASAYEMRFGSSAIRSPKFESLSELPERLSDGLDEGYQPGTPGDVESSMFTDLVPSTRYCFGVRALDRAGNRGQASVFCAITTAKEPD